MSASAGSRLRRPRGQSMVEFVIVVPVLLMLILGALQFALVFRARTTVEYAAFEAARAGALNNARLWAMEHAFARAMAPLYTNGFWRGNSPGSCERSAGSGGSYDIDARLLARRQGTPPAPAALDFEHARCARDEVRRLMKADRTRILLVNPTDASFRDHGKDTDFGRVIPNDNLMWRDSKVESNSSQSVQDANLIKVHVGFCYELSVPFVNRIMSAILRNGVGPVLAGPLPNQVAAANAAGAGGLQDVFGKACAGDPDAPRIPIYAQSLMRMHTEAIQAANAGGAVVVVDGLRCVGKCL